METRSLELFLDLAKTLRFRATSRRCHLTPSALTRAIVRLEQEVGNPLFARDRRSVKLTAAGQRFREYATAAMTHWQAFLSGSHEASLRGELTFYCSVTASYAVLPRLLSHMRQRHPDIAVTLRTGDAEHGIERVLDSEVDAALVPEPRQPNASIDLIPLLVTPLLLVGPACPCPLQVLISEQTPWTELPLILPETGPARLQIEAWFKSQRLRPSIHAYVSGNEAILSMASLGLGVGIVPRLVTEHAPTSIRVRYLSNGPDLKPYTISLCTRRQRNGNPVIDVLKSAARASFAPGGV